MNFPRKKMWPNSTTLSALLFITHLSQAETLQPRQYSDFDTYVLALSWQTGFCQSMHERKRNEPAECRNQQEQPNKRAFLTVHGLWPGLPYSVSSRGVDEKRWMRYGCATRPLPNMPEVRSSQKCRAAMPELSQDISRQLAEVMPGAGGKSCLERYEFAKHAACFDFDSSAYFGTMIRLNNEVKQSAFGRFLENNYGKVVKQSAVRQALIQSWGKDAARATKLMCHGNPAYLTEIQMTLWAKGINAPLTTSTFASQKRPGNCGKTLRIDMAGY